jgi:hypothetical protein
MVTLGIVYSRILEIPVESWRQHEHKQNKPPFYWRVLHARNVNIIFENIE